MKDAQQPEKEGGPRRSLHHAGGGGLNTAAQQETLGKEAELLLSTSNHFMVRLAVEE